MECVYFCCNWYDRHCVKIVQIRSFLRSVLSCVKTKHRVLHPKSLYSVWLRENKDQKKLRIWTLFTQWNFSMKKKRSWSHDLGSDFFVRKRSFFRGLGEGRGGATTSLDIVDCFKKNRSVIPLEFFVT